MSLANMNTINGIVSANSHSHIETAVKVSVLQQQISNLDISNIDLSAVNNQIQIVNQEINTLQEYIVKFSSTYEITDSSGNLIIFTQ